MPNYSDLIENFRHGDVIFGLDGDITAAKAALNAAHVDTADYWGRLAALDEDALFGEIGKDPAALMGLKEPPVTPDVVLQADLTNAAMPASPLRGHIGEGITEVRAARSAGRPVMKPPMPSPMAGGGDIRKTLPGESGRGSKFAAFLGEHPKYDPKLMGGCRTGNGAIAPLGADETDASWMRVSRKWRVTKYVTDSMDAGAPLRLKTRQIAPRTKGQNKQLVEDNFDSIDWDAYPMLWDIFTDQDLANVINYKVWQRTSKAGLEFQTTQRKRKVHFCIDGFLKGDSMRIVVEKIGSKGRSITSGELRWVYRNWSNPDVARNVRFWTINGEADPPWEMAAYRDLWQTYQPRALRASGASRPLAAALQVHSEPPATTSTATTQDGGPG